jgi:hypothetical protein
MEHEKLKIVDNRFLEGPHIFIQIDDIVGFYDNTDGYFIHLIVRNSSENVPVFRYWITKEIESRIKQHILTNHKQSVPEIKESLQNKPLFSDDHIEFSDNKINIWMIGRNSGGKMWPMSLDRRTFTAILSCSKTLQKNYLSYSDPEVFIAFENDSFVISKIDRSTSNESPHVVRYHLSKEQIIEFVKKHETEIF